MKEFIRESLRPRRSAIVDAIELEYEMFRLTGGHPHEFVQRFREVWDMPYVVVPTPWIKVTVRDPYRPRTL